MTDPDSAPWLAVSAAFGALGRAFLCLDGDLRILHSSSVLDELLGPGAASGAEGCSAEELLGAPLFGPAAPLRQALLAGQRREGLRVMLRGRGESPRAAGLRCGRADSSSRGGLGSARRVRGCTSSGGGRAHRQRTLRPGARRLQAVLEEHHWRRSEAARALGISRTTLWRMMREAGIEV